ncbi:MAG: proline iminopeptidase-family hydrolase [Chitinophagales bacterium]
MKHFNFLFIAIALIVLLTAGCQNPVSEVNNVATIDCAYNDFTTSGDFQAGGVQMIPLKEGYKVWTKRFGNSPMKVVLLHGGPGLTHEYMECFESFFPQANIEFYHYDQLGSYYSDQPEDDRLWTMDRFVEELEQLRVALGLNQDNFYILGNSWGGILAMEYALKYQQNLKGMIISNMTADFDKYEAYNAELRKTMRATLVDSLEYYESRELFHDETYLNMVFQEFYTKHICRFPADQWPEPVMRSFRHINQHVYEYIQGPSEFVPGGWLKGWSVWDQLPDIKVPTLMIGAKYDSMNPEEMKEMAALVQNGRYLYCANGSHLAMWDEQEFYMNGVIEFIKDVHEGELSEE